MWRLGPGDGLLGAAGTARSVVRRGTRRGARPDGPDQRGCRRRRDWLRPGAEPAEAGAGAQQWFPDVALCRHPSGRRADRQRQGDRSAAQALAPQSEIGRASCRERVGPYVEIWVVARSLKKKTNNLTQLHNNK